MPWTKPLPPDPETTPPAIKSDSLGVGSFRDLVILCLPLDVIGIVGCTTLVYGLIGPREALLTAIGLTVTATIGFILAARSL